MVEKHEMHEDSGERCLKEHLDSNGDRMPACIKCGVCKQWLRPCEMEDRCPGPEVKPLEDLNLAPFGGRAGPQYNALFEAMHRVAWEDGKQIYDYLEDTPRTSMVTEIVDCLNRMGFEIARIPE